MKWVYAVLCVLGLVLPLLLFHSLRPTKWFKYYWHRERNICKSDIGIFRCRCHRLICGVMDIYLSRNAQTFGRILVA
jgi:hypothetical protein